MKKRIINLLGLSALCFSCVVSSALPVYATESISTSESTSESTSVIDSTTTSESTSEEYIETPSVLTIKANNKTNGGVVTTASFKVTDRTTGSVVSFTKKASGEYTVDTTGSYKFVEPNSNGTIIISGLNGYYAISDTGNDSNLFCESSTNNISIAKEEEKTIFFEYIKNSGSLSITLLAQDDSAISDAKFVLRNANNSIITFSSSNGTYTYSESSSTTELTTNAAGKIIVEGLPSGSYTVEQTSAPVVYNGDLVKKSVVVENQKQISVSLLNTKEYGDLIISVVDADNSSKSLSGAEYTIKDKSGNTVYVTKNTEGSYSYSRTSSDSTIVSVDGNISVNGLPSDTYTIIEKTAPAGYDSSESKEIEIKSDNTTNIQINSIRSLGSLSITITDEETNDAIEGFSYQLISKESEEPLTFKESSENYAFALNGESILKTNKDGKIIITNIPTGNYYLKQVEAAKGYLLDINPTEQTVTKDTETVFTTIASKSNSAVTIINNDGEPVKDVKFEILDEENNIVITDITNENGKFLISGIQAGTYTLKITDVPETYGKYSDTVEFTIDETGLSNGLGRITLEYNKVVLNLGKPNVNVILLNKRNGKEITEVTDNNGTAVFSQLKYGDYEISLEDKSISFETIKFNIGEDTEELVYDADIVNDNSSESEETTTSTTSKKVNSSFILIGISIIIGAFFGAYVYFSYKKSKKSKIKVAYDEDGNAIIYEEESEDIEELSDEQEEQLIENEDLDDSESLKESDDSLETDNEESEDFLDDEDIDESQEELNDSLETDSDELEEESTVSEKEEN